MTCGLERAVKCSWARVKGDRVWLDEVSVARCAHESFLVGLRVIGSESSNELLRTDEGERERRSIGSGRVGKTGDGGEDEVEVGADEKDEASVELRCVWFSEVDDPCDDRGRLDRDRCSSDPPPRDELRTIDGADENEVAIPRGNGNRGVLAPDAARPAKYSCRPSSGARPTVELVDAGPGRAVVVDGLPCADRLPLLAVRVRICDCV